ncbi:hypothetical protein BDN72DRAFT_831841 [Pluteus cervinus]|uniref:Uncharacterized protein n=1 Tax=Pluteus cervinus TaxID=181527 RepID=A0ACD3BCC1_9AGAR|nr:hypothetical protein BDN72DRAFT_831841 [Pluteus cervinus]
MFTKFTSRSWITLSPISIIRRRRRSSRNKPVDTSAVNTLPTELLQDIFQVVFLSHEDVYGRIPIVLSLGQVCRRWREIAHGYPSLWRTFDVTAKSCYSRNILRLCLENSAPCLLDFRVTIQHIKGFSDIRIFYRATGLMCELVKHCSRWQHTNFITNIAYPLCDVQPGSLKELVSVSFSKPKGSMGLDIQDFWENVCHEAHTQLRSVSWGRSGMVSPPTHAPWHQLVQIDFGLVARFRDVALILPLCQSMESLTICGIWDENFSLDRSPPLRIKPLTCNTLKELSIRGSAGIFDISSLLNSLIVPNVQVVKVYFNSESFYPKFPSDSLFILLSRSRCSLRRLECREFRKTGDQELVARYLRAPFCQTLTGFHIDCDTTPDILDGLKNLPYLRDVHLPTTNPASYPSHAQC